MDKEDDAWAITMLEVIVIIAVISFGICAYSLGKNIGLW
jgi:hypothetical protein